MYGTIGDGWLVRKRLELESERGIKFAPDQYTVLAWNEASRLKKLLQTSILNTGYQLWVLNCLSFYHIK
jgi:hypothetical protein